MHQIRYKAANDQQGKQNSPEYLSSFQVENSLLPTKHFEIVPFFGCSQYEFQDLRAYIVVLG